MFESDFSIPISDRGFLYGDGLFETIAFDNNEIELLDFHYERVLKAADLMGYQIPNWVDLETIKAIFLSLISKNNLGNKARLKLVIWRKEGGLFASNQTDVNILFLSQKWEGSRVLEIQNWKVCDTVKINSNGLFFKTLSSIEYVIAGNFLLKNNLEELVLLNSEGMICEGLYSNIFWKKDNHWFTPSLSTGCISGVRRRELLDKWQNQVTEIALTLEKWEFDEIWWVNSLTIKKFIK